ncbi:MAG: RNA polymerase-associated protein RapA, partial [Pseudomonadota bacterium]
SFVQEEERYKPIADLVHQLEGQDLVSAEHRSSIEKTLSPVALENLDLDNLDKDVLMERLLDEHGTGRVLFRNTRTAVKGFPEREVHAYPMAMPDAYRDVLAMLQGQALSEMQLLLSPELLYQVVSENSGRDWVKLDPRVAKLVEMTKAIRPQKMLVITASADTALDLTEHLRVTEGIQAAVFHEGMSLIERDRAAAWFADQISGAPLLICSEIGSEGRNFQFAHHLFLFDLPLNPDLLEQRIGRLDRIGQRNTVQIHVPYLENSAQSIMFRWYEDGLNAFAQTCPTGHQVFNQEHERLERVLHDVVESPGKVAEAVDSLVEDTHRLNRHLIDAMSTGRDRLLEFNSCRPEKAETLRKRALEMDNASTLQPYLEGVFDCIGVDYEVHSEDCFAVSASPNMMAVLPQLPEDGMTITYDRETALTFEDVDYLTWDHPLVVACMDWILSGEQGNTAVLALPVAGAQRGHLLLESIFILETASTAVSNSARYLPPTTLRVFIDQTGKRYEHLDSIQTRDQKIDRVRPDVAKKVIAAKTGLINKMIRASRKLAEGQVVSIKNNAFVDVRASLEAEISRLDYLLKINPNVRQEEIDFFNASLDGLNEQIDNASLRLDALRVIVAT